MGAEFVSLSLPPILIGICVAVSCALPGNFLMLRGQALIGDAISHVVLPGIVVAFLITGVAATGPMLLGAMGAAIVAVLAIEAIRRLGRIESGAAVGVVFTTMFAGGVLLLEQSDASGVHLDVEHALFGNLEALIWLDATGWHSLLDRAALATLPVVLPRVAGALALIIVLLLLLWRPLSIMCFDEGFAHGLGIKTGALSMGLVVISAVAAVAAFDAVGAIIVIAMFICPPAAARLMTNSLKTQVLLSSLLAAGAAILGYILAGYAPIWLGWSSSISAAGTIATVSGAFLGAAALLGKHRKPSSY